MKTIALTKGHEAIVDDEDYEALNQHKWYATEKVKIVYACRMLCQVAGQKTYAFMHNVIFPPPKGLFVNHLNHNGLDNRRSNLEHITHSENTRHGRYKPGISGHRNISWHRQSDRYRVQFRFNYDIIYGGSYATLEEAVLARNAMHKRYGISK